MSAHSIYGAKQLFQYVQLFSLVFFIIFDFKDFPFCFIDFFIGWKNNLFLNNKFCSEEGRIVSKKTLGTESKIF